MKRPTLIHGGDRDFERRLFNSEYEYERLREIVRRLHADTEVGPNAPTSAWFRGVLEFLFVHGYELTEREGAKVIPFKGGGAK